jgi:transposase-like protein
LHRNNTSFIISHHPKSGEEGKLLLRPQWLAFKVKCVFVKEIEKDIASLPVAIKRYRIPYARLTARPSGLILSLRQRYLLCKTYGKTFEFNTATSAKKGFFFMKREKKGMCFLPSTQKRYV